MEEFKTLLVNEVRRRIFGEGIPRIKKCLAELSEEEVWFRPNENSNGVGNLVLHLCGNVRQWLLTGLDRQLDIRKRQEEFDEKGPMAKSELEKRLNQLDVDVEEFLTRLPDEILTQKVVVQGFDENGISVLVHVVEHFSYHVGQIAYFTKWRKNMDVGFYADEDLDVTG